jgi:hypothetical protein
MIRLWLRGSGAPILAASVLFSGLVASAVVAPDAATASCGRVLGFEETARLPGISIFTGRAVGEVSGDRVEFVVDRWYTGAHAAGVIHFNASAVFLVEPPAAGVIPAVVAQTVSGDAIGMVRGEPLFVAATGSEQTGYAPVVCGIGAVALASTEGRDYLAKAVAKFGAGRPASATVSVAGRCDACRPAPNFATALAR